MVETGFIVVLHIVFANHITLLMLQLSYFFVIQDTENYSSRAYNFYICEWSIQTIFQAGYSQLIKLHELLSNNDKKNRINNTHKRIEETQQKMRKSHNRTQKDILISLIDTIILCYSKNQYTMCNHLLVSILLQYLSGNFYY